MRGMPVIPTEYVKFKRSFHPPLPFPLPSRLFSLSYVQCSISVQKDDLILPPRCSVEDPLDDFISLLKNSSRVLSEVSSLHSRAMKAGFTEYGQVSTTLLNLYAKCCSLDNACKLFDDMSQRNALNWTILLTACVRSGHNELGLSLFSRMLVDGVLPNCFTLATIFKCCAKKNNILEVGKSIHGWIVRNGIEKDIVLQNSILDFYAKSESFQYARTVFEIMTERDTISWNVMIGVHIKFGDLNGAMELFRASPSQDVSSWNTFISGQMQNGSDKAALQFLHLMAKVGPMFNHYTLSITLVLAAKLALLDLGKQIHNKLLRLGFENDAFIKNSLVNMYSKCGRMETSLTIFCDRVQGNKISQLAPAFIEPLANTISWSTLIAGFVQNGTTEEALVLFCRMLYEGVAVDSYTLTSIASACADAGILEQGRQIHACIEKLGHGFDVFLASAIIDMYAKCGSLDDAREIFDGIECRNVVFWTSMIVSYALHGEGREAIRVFEMMLDKKIMPNEISFTGILSACSHEALIVEGYKYFKLMQKDHGIVPTIEHLNCMVDLLGRCGLLDEAKNFICKYNLRHHSVAWNSLILACRVHGDIETARWASEQLVQIEPHEAGSYVLMSGIYAIKREWEASSRLWCVMKNKGFKKQPGCSWIQLKDKVHSFVAGDKSHIESSKLFSHLEKLGDLKDLGYSTGTNLVLHGLREEQRELVQ
ncbi:Pentatricopeptide repeat-containing protein [Dendrobium catenatum]|uniref:Pentatricopeptide repeat-containing protein n=1 Tax=Dendrobium catenatum TaxID=906689 RepID=A0A2I0XIV0_9ASPA|nr:Pentatricopeptide repeat-containing protein [Dendrobium catenatum]